MNARPRQRKRRASCHDPFTPDAFAHWICGPAPDRMVLVRVCPDARSSPWPPFPLQRVLLAPLRWASFLLVVLALDGILWPAAWPAQAAPALVLCALAAGAVFGALSVTGGWLARRAAARTQRSRGPRRAAPSLAARLAEVHAPGVVRG